MDSDELRALLAVAQTGSYHAAARSLGVSRSTLRRRIGELEARFGRVLVQVTPGGAVLTPAGVKVAHRGQAVLHEIESMFAHLHLEGGEPTGVLRIGAPVGLPPQIFYPILSLLRGRFPKVRIRVRFFENVKAGLAEDVDAFADFGQLPPMPGWVTYDLVPADETLWASPGYLRWRGTPVTIADLEGHELIAWTPPDRDPRRWPAADGTYFTVAPVITCSDNHVLHHLAAAGAGIVLMSHTELRLPGLEPAIGELVPVLPDLVRGPRMFRVRVSEDLAGLTAFQTLVETSIEIGKQLAAAGRS